jgi:hypothetical protein
VRHPHDAVPPSPSSFIYNRTLNEFASPGSTHYAHPSVSPPQAPTGPTETETAEDADGEDVNAGEGGAGGSRALKQTRRAAQNRAAQRAFRERREKYVKELEKRSEVGRPADAAQPGSTETDLSCFRKAFGKLYGEGECSRCT